MKRILCRVGSLDLPNAAHEFGRSPNGTGLTFAVLPRRWDERTFNHARGTTEVDPLRPFRIQSQHEVPLIVAALHLVGWAMSRMPEYGRPVPSFLSRLDVTRARSALEGLMCGSVKPGSGHLAVPTSSTGRSYRRWSRRDDHRLANRGPPHGMALSQTVNRLSRPIKHGAPAELR